MHHITFQLRVFELTELSETTVQDGHSPPVSTDKTR